MDNIIVVFRQGDLVHGRYRVLSAIGAGGQAHVYKVADTESDGVYALKLLLSGSSGDDKMSVEAFQRFAREYQLLSDLSHPNIVKVFDFKRLNGIQSYYIMEYIEGGSLHDRIKDKEKPPFSFPEALQILYGTALALQFAHAKNIIHRDLKPGNILLTTAGEPRVVDFGLARPVEKGYTLTMQDITVGTPSYMSPEQLQNKNVNHKTDIYAFGILAFEIVTRICPFEAATTLEAVEHFYNSKLPKIEAADKNPIPKWYQRFVEHCIEKRQEDRVQSMDDVVDTLEEQMRKLELLPPDPNAKNSVIMKLLDLIFGNI